MNYAMLTMRPRPYITAATPPVVPPEPGWNISTAALNSRYSVSSQETAPTGVSFSGDGSKMFVLGINSDSIHQYDLATPWSVATSEYADSLSLVHQDPAGLAFKSDGTRLYFVEPSLATIHEYELSTAWDITTALRIRGTSTFLHAALPTSVAFKGDGSAMYVTDADSGSVVHYSLSTAWNISTKTHVQSFSTSAQASDPSSLAFRPDGKRMYFVGIQGGDAIYEYGLSSPWDISTALFSRSITIDIASTLVGALAFKDDGLRMYVAVSGVSADDEIIEYHLT